ncbi:MAG: outer membrane protein [Bacteroidetes bacterium]|jgi:outer membrane protein|nr:outer membrane protein [Bacteroidota bacterium]
MKEFFKKKQNWFNLAIVCVVAVLINFQFKSKAKIGFVRSNDLVYGFQGMKEANHEQESKTQEFKSNIDTLQMDLKRMISKYNAEYSALSVKERAEKEKLIYLQQENLKKYTKSAEEKIKESDLNLTQGILNQINALVEEYAKENKYELVFGTTSSGNILYGETAIDITEPVLSFLNTKYINETDSPKQ